MFSNKKARGHSVPGYVAITSIVILGFFSMALVFSVSFAGFLLRANISDTYAKLSAKELASACLNLALLKLTNDQNYTGNETISLDASSCEIYPVSSNGLQRTVRTGAAANQASSTLTATVQLSSTTLTLVSWNETAGF